MSSASPPRARFFFALACVWTAFIAFLAFMAFKDQLSLSKVMTLEHGQLRNLLSEMIVTMFCRGA